MNDDPVIPNKAELDPTKRIFMSGGYLKILDIDTYGLFRDLIIQVTKEDGSIEREKAGQPVGPLGVFREKRPEDPPQNVALRTHHPTEDRPLELVRMS